MRAERKTPSAMICVCHGLLPCDRAHGPQLVNARQYLNVVILDQLLARAELRVGIGEHAETVTIARGTLRTISCPGDEACPAWPHAGQALARRQP